MRRCGLMMARRLTKRAGLRRRSSAPLWRLLLDCNARSLTLSTPGLKCAFRRATVRRGLVILGFNSIVFTPVIWFWTDS